jgi:ABC-type nitrate/sulfonate/bicarbonate transport system substrate-binding protein
VATPADNLYAAWQGWAAKLAEVAAQPIRPNYTLPGGASVDFLGYQKFLAEMEKAAHEAYLRALGPFTVIQTAR